GSSAAAGDHRRSPSRPRRGSMWWPWAHGGARGAAPPAGGTRRGTKGPVHGPVAGTSRRPRPCTLEEAAGPSRGGRRDDASTERNTVTHLTTDDVPLPAEIGPRVREFRRLMMNYKFGIDEVMTKITVLRDEFRHVHDDNPIEHLGSRLKSLDSIVAKARRKGIPLTPEGVRENMFDVAGVRVTCAFVSDIYRVRDLLV